MNRFWFLLFMILTPAVAESQIFRGGFGGGSGAILPLNGLEDSFDHSGNSFNANVGIGDDPNVVMINLGFSYFGGQPFDDKGGRSFDFGLRSDWFTHGDRKLSPLVRVGLGVHNLDADRTSKVVSAVNKTGGELGVGLRWRALWNLDFAIVASGHGIVSRKQEPREWATVTFEFFHWMD